jgi:hypothetical protein
MLRRNANLLEGMTSMKNKRFRMPAVMYLAIFGFSVSMPVSVGLSMAVFRVSPDFGGGPSMGVWGSAFTIGGAVIGFFLQKRFPRWFPPLRPLVYGPAIGALLGLFSLFFKVLFLSCFEPILRNKFYNLVPNLDSILDAPFIPTVTALTIAGLLVGLSIERLSQTRQN